MGRELEKKGEEKNGVGGSKGRQKREGRCGNGHMCCAHRSPTTLRPALSDREGPRMNGAGGRDRPDGRNFLRGLYSFSSW